MSVSDLKSQVRVTPHFPFHLYFCEREHSKTTFRLQAGHKLYFYHLFFFLLLILCSCKTLSDRDIIVK